MEGLEAAHCCKARGYGTAQLVAAQPQHLHQRPAAPQAGVQRARWGVVAARRVEAAGEGRGDWARVCFGPSPSFPRGPLSLRPRPAPPAATLPDRCAPGPPHRPAARALAALRDPTDAAAAPESHPQTAKQPSLDHRYAADLHRGHHRESWMRARTADTRDEPDGLVRPYSCLLPGASPRPPGPGRPSPQPVNAMRAGAGGGDCRLPRATSAGSGAPAQVPLAAAPRHKVRAAAPDPALRCPKAPHPCAQEPRCGASRTFGRGCSGSVGRAWQSVGRMRQAEGRVRGPLALAVARTALFV